MCDSLSQALYARRAAKYASFHEPRRSWLRRRKVPKADRADEGELAALEDQLSLEEIAHFRAGEHSDRVTDQAPYHGVQCCWS